MFFYRRSYGNYRANHHWHQGYVNDDRPGYFGGRMEIDPHRSYSRGAAGAGGVAAGGGGASGSTSSSSGADANGGSGGGGATRYDPHGTVYMQASDECARQGPNAVAVAVHGTNAAAVRRDPSYEPSRVRFAREAGVASREWHKMNRTDPGQRGYF